VAARERLDKLLVDRGLVASRERARALVMSGAVLVRGQVETKPGTMLAADVEITLKEQDHPYVSRGALKLVKGLDTFHIDPAGKTCLDIGASTGGFTHVLLERGAAKVYAIDVGYGQLAWSLRQDPRVVVLERENVRNMDVALVPEPCDLAVIDVSFISLTLVLPRVAQLLRPPAGKPIVALVKPQFEVGRESVGKGGVVRDEAARRGAITKVRDWALAHGFEVGHPSSAVESSTGSPASDDVDLGPNVVESPITGPAGNVDPGPNVVESPITGPAGNVDLGPNVVESPITGPAGNVEYLLLLRTAGAESAPVEPSASS
jgi:23S rRNA (cytidine1920-2'-O)/16S rRNA (cytidine1409-2'-O)-methyltransferase